MDKDYVAYTDGAFSSARNQGGVGVVLLKGDKKILEFSKMFKDTTNNRMELSAIIIALRCIKDKIDSLTIYSDSMYCIGCATLGWKRKKNVQMWVIFDKEMERVSKLCPNIRFQHVKGHEDSEWNNYCDKLAVRASQSL